LIARRSGGGCWGRGKKAARVKALSEGSTSLQDPPKKSEGYAAYLNLLNDGEIFTAGRRTLSGTWQGQTDRGKKSRKVSNARKGEGLFLKLKKNPRSSNRQLGEEATLWRGNTRAR